MFSISNKQEAGFEKIILSDDAAKTYAVVLPSCGAILHDFVAERKGIPLHVIDSYTSGQEFRENAESKGFLGSKLSPFVCRLYHGAYRFGENNYKVENFYREENAIHGLLYKKAFSVIGQSADEQHASVTLKYEYRAEDKGYPFNYDCIVTWQLKNDNRLSVTTECINKDERPIPMQDGWHPYFTLGAKVDDLQLEFQSGEMVEFDSELIPTQRLIPYSEFNTLKRIGERFFDNCFTLNRDASQPLCVLRNPAKKTGIAIYPEKSYPYLQIYIPPHRNSIAIENLSGAPNGFNNGMGCITLEPDQTATFTTTYQINHME